MPLPRFDKTAARIALTYTFLASVWIISSDWILAALVTGGEDRQVAFQNAKGAFFATVTGLGLYTAIAWALARQRRLQQEKKRVEEMLHVSQRLEALGSLAATVVHDFNNIIMVIRSMTELARMEDLDPAKMGERIRMIEKAAANAQQVVRQLTLFLRQERTGFSQVDLVAAVQEFLPMLNQVVTRSVTLIARLPDSPILTHCDRAQVEQVLLNLAINARDAMTACPVKVVTVVVEALFLHQHHSLFRPEPVTGKFVRLSVSDTGCGIPPENLARVFEPFFTTKPVGQGTGLGLATAFRVMQQHGGWIEVKSKAGVGTQFDLYFPSSPPPTTP
ncbi:MAG: ATP-binding protein [Opitutaceae bacterium]